MAEKRYLSKIGSRFGERSHGFYKQQALWKEIKKNILEWIHAYTK